MKSYPPYSIFLFFGLLILSCSKEDPAPPLPPDQPGSKQIKIIYDEVENTPVVLAGSPGLNFIVSFERELDGELMEFTSLQNELPLIMEDGEGNKWNIFGYAIQGSRQGQRLRPVESMMGYWFSFGAMFPGVEVYMGESKDPELDTSGDDEWAVPRDFVFIGAGRDGIPALNNPPVIEFRERNFIEAPFYTRDGDLVVGAQVNGQLRAYPHPVLNWHEIVNDKLGGEDIAVVYCPLTGTGTIWNRSINGSVSDFGVSGLLYNNNVIPFDRSTESHWSQMLSLCVNGQRMGEEPEVMQAVETSWSTWKQIAGQPEVLSEETGHNRDYLEYPYGDYRTNDDFLLFPIIFDDTRLPRKERVHCLIIDGQAKVYRFRDFN